MLKRLLRNCALKILSLTEQTSSAHDPASSQEAKGAPSDDQRRKALVAARRKAGEPITAGSIQLLGMEAIKQKVGEDWHRVSSRAMSIADRVIREHLTIEDIYTQQGDDTFILFFADLREKAAADMARRLSIKIKEAVGKAIPAAVSVGIDHFVAEVNDVAFKDDNGHDRSFSEAIFASLTQIRAQAEQNATNRRASLLRSARFVFRPVWSPSKRAVMLFRCMLDGASGTAALELLAALADPDDLRTAIADLDAMLLGKAIASLHQVLQRDTKSLLLIPVHFSTMAGQSSSSEYVRLCETMPHAYRKFIYFELHGTPLGTPQTRVSEMARMLHPFCQGMLFQIDEISAGMFQPLTADFSGVSVDLRAGHVQSELFTLLMRTVSIARTKGLLILLHGANTFTQLQSASMAGVDYVSGDAVHGSLDEPKSAFRFTPAWLLERRLANNRGVVRLSASAVRNPVSAKLTH